MKPAVFCWSGGKDSALCLYRVLQEKKYDVKFLITTVSEQFRRISMHGVKEELLDSQARSLGIPLIKIYVSEGTNVEYERKMEEALLNLKSKGIEEVIFGDIFLDELRRYREANLSKVGMKGVFPLWKQNTAALLADFISLKFKTVICCTNDAYLGEDWVGRIIDEKLALSIPDTVDPCGENGEYHTFCFDGPVFESPINILIGEKIYKPLVIKTTHGCKMPASSTKGFWFCEISPKVI